jgi:UDP-N-acetylglucosamine acyltransferase
MGMIDPTARIEPGAIVEDGVSIGPYCIIGRDVVIGAGCRLIAQVHVAGRTAIGARTVIHPFASLGGVPQSATYHGEPTRLVVGTDCDIREGVTMSIGTDAGGGITEVGDRGFFMAYSHVGHDCRVGSDVVFANCATLGGHCIIGDYVFIGGLSAVHQHTRIGAHAMIGGVTGLRADVIPFGLAAGTVARLRGVNIVGLKRRKFPAESIRAVRSAYQSLFFGEGVSARRLEAAEAKFGHDPAVAQIVAFVRGKRDRPLCLPGRHAEV